MLKPNKYTDVSLSVIGVSAEILAQLKKEPSQKYNGLRNKVVYRLGDSAKQNFLLHLRFYSLWAKSGIIRRKMQSNYCMPKTKK